MLESGMMPPSAASALPAIHTARIVRRTSMPDDYGERLTAEELENLFAFLAKQSLRDDAPESDAPSGD